MRGLLLAGIAALVLFAVWLLQATPSQATLPDQNTTSAAAATTAAAAAPQSGGGSSQSAKPEPPIESSLLTPAEFHELVDEVRRSLPLKTSLAKLATKESFEHTTPAFLIDAGRQLARVAGALAKNPQLRAEAVVFYSDCASNSGTFDSVRAVCLADLGKLDGGRARVDAPERVQRLAERLQD